MIEQTDVHAAKDRMIHLLTDELLRALAANAALTRDLAATAILSDTDGSNGSHQGVQRE